VVGEGGGVGEMQTRLVSSICCGIGRRKGIRGMGDREKDRGKEWRSEAPCTRRICHRRLRFAARNRGGLDASRVQKFGG
jgi:hypothetical protein